MADALAHISGLIPSLIPVPAEQPGVCRVCRSSASERECHPCRDARGKLGDLPDVLPISLMTNESPLYEALRQYKNEFLGDEVRSRHVNTVAALLAAFIRQHHDCLGTIRLSDSNPVTTKDVDANDRQPNNSTQATPIQRRA